MDGCTWEGGLRGRRGEGRGQGGREDGRIDVGGRERGRGIEREEGGREGAGREGGWKDVGGREGGRSNMCTCERNLDRLVNKGGAVSTKIKVRGGGVGGGGAETLNADIFWT